jgi:hypothetical protein
VTLAKAKVTFARTSAASDPDTGTRFHARPPDAVPQAVTGAYDPNNQHAPPDQLHQSSDSPPIGHGTQVVDGVIGCSTWADVGRTRGHSSARRRAMSGLWSLGPS